MPECKVSLPPEYVATKGLHAPDWARAVAAHECKTPTLTLFWIVQKSRRRRAYVSGMARYHGKIVHKYGERERISGPCINVNAGFETPIRYQWAVLLHEIAHINVGPNHDHDKVWQKEVVRLYRRYNLLQEVLDNKWYGYACEKRAIEVSLNRSKSQV